uniref:Reverse transcriptase domain-containing protein n=1 Tax=Tanacetum cinerariifolium TaxID=118510 RepID=A0A6L2LQV2_TANCI|nr:hypothetical protein [Tanacetum cinerariifolium]
MEDTMLELLEVCRQKEFYCMYNDVDDLIESALNSKLLSINLRSQRLDKKKQEVKNIVEHPTKRGTQPQYSLSMRYEHLSTPPKTESDEILKSSVEKLVPIPSECEVTSDNESECDVPVCEDSSTCEDHSEILSDFNNNDISSNDDAFEDIEYVEASPLDSELVSEHMEETISGSTTAHANNSLPEYDSFCFEIEPDQERLTSVDIFDDSTYDPLLEVVDPSFPRPPPKPPDVEFFFDFEPDSGEVISAVINNIDEFNEDECFDPGGEINVFANIEDDDYFPFIFVIRIFLPYLIYPEVSPLLLFAGSEDTIFDPGIST